MRARNGWTRALAATALLAASFVMSGCGSDGATRGGGSHVGAALGGVGFEPGDAVSDEVSVTWKNLDPGNPPVTQTLVNASSETGRLLKSGRASSTATRVISDQDMGTMLDELEDLDFFDHATSGLGLTNAPSTTGRRGIVVVTRGAKTWGMMLTPGMGQTPVPKVYTDCKKLIFAVHGAVQGFEVKINADPDRVFSAPSIRMKRR